MILRTFIVAAFALAALGCQSTKTTTVEAPVLSEKDLLRTKWACDVKRESDFQLLYGENDFFATLTLPRLSLQQSKRLRTDFILPGQIEDIVSIKFANPAVSSTRLMKGYIPMHVCGDFFVRNRTLKDNAVSIFTDLAVDAPQGDMVWEIVYIDSAGEVFTTQKALRFDVR